MVETRTKTRAERAAQWESLAWRLSARRGWTFDDSMARLRAMALAIWVSRFIDHHIREHRESREMDAGYLWKYHWEKDDLQAVVKR